MGADENLVATFEERTKRIDLTALRTRSVAKVPFRLNGPVGPKAELAQRLVGEARAHGFLRHPENLFLAPPIVKLVERDEHKSAAFSPRGWRLDQQVLLTPFFVGALLHRPHAKLVDLGRAAVAGIRDRDGGD